jgi:hypothetical protein
MREMLATHKDLAKQLAALEKKYIAQFQVVFDAIRRLMADLPQTRRSDESDSTESPTNDGGCRDRAASSAMVMKTLAQ